MIPEIVAMPFEQADMVSHQGVSNLLLGEEFDVVQVLLDVFWDHSMLALLMEVPNRVTKKDINRCLSARTQGIKYQTGNRPVNVRLTRP